MFLCQVKVWGCARLKVIFLCSRTSSFLTFLVNRCFFEPQSRYFILKYVFIVSGGLGLFQCKSICRLAIRAANATRSAWYLLNLSTGDTPKIAIKGHGDRGVPKILESELKNDVQKGPSLGQEKNVCVWSAGEREHLIHLSSESGKNLFSLALV